MKPDVLALIPARGGSKGVPGKNKRPVGGRPLISYSIDAARGARHVTHTVVTSDDPEILEIARRAGVIALERPGALAQDQSPVIDAVRHAVEFLAAEQQAVFRTIVLLQPTTPLRTAADIDAAVELHHAEGRPVCSVCRCEDNHPARMYRIEERRLRSLMPELSAVRRQDLPAIYHRNGALYVFGQDAVRSGKIIDDDMVPYVMPPESSINIDTELDLAVLETFLRTRK